MTRTSLPVRIDLELDELIKKKQKEIQENYRLASKALAKDIKKCSKKVGKNNKMGELQF